MQTKNIAIIQAIFLISAVIALMYFLGYAHAATPVQPDATRVETDQKTGVIRFIVNSKEQARIDATGLHVRDSIDYTGALTDGSETYHDTATRAVK